jgi:hypothetical protein
LFPFSRALDIDLVSQRRKKYFLDPLLLLLSTQLNTAFSLLPPAPSQPYQLGDSEISEKIIKPSVGTLLNTVRELFKKIESPYPLSLALHALAGPVATWLASPAATKDFKANLQDLLSELFEATSRSHNGRYDEEFLESMWEGEERRRKKGAKREGEGRRRERKGGRREPKEKGGKEKGGERREWKEDGGGPFFFFLLTPNFF